MDGERARMQMCLDLQRR